MITVAVTEKSLIKIKKEMEAAHAGASHSLCFRATEEAVFSKMFSTRCHQVNKTRKQLLEP